MAISFGDAKGTAKKGLIESYEYKNGDQKVRIVDGLLARYVYWIKGTNNKNIPFECLSFDREAEAFVNKEKDWVTEFYPDLKCSWAYATKCLDPTDGKVKVLNLKKKLLKAILNAAEDLGDPTDLDNGWWVHFKRTKTGPNIYNVEYELQPLRCKKEPLTEKEKALVEESPSIDKCIPRPTAEAQKKLLEEIQAKLSEGSDDMNSDVKEEFDVE